MNLIQIFMEMKDSELREAFEEFMEHENTCVLKDGIIRNIADKLGGNATLNIINVEHSLLREMAGRWYYKS